ncbi:phage tail protein [Streptomyces cylindrosporus]|uniref:Tape measure protein n=1 Tax=Streptomyces cylindrosporus TaxID=2927583 RepID=A0ABS9Y1C7_9ACTN|nr:hypothetical protein [Streptomyces cylindrosporus]MCI3271028.1 hypothetical protein [Streptomyces cylindrosporus]
MRDALGGIGQVARGLGASVRNGLGNGITAVGNGARAASGPSLKLFAGMSAGAVGAAGAMAAVPLAMVGMGVMAAAQNKQVQTAFTSLKDHASKTMQSLAKPLVGPLTDAAEQLGSVFDSLAPKLGQIFKAAAPMIEPLVHGVGELVLGLADGLLPVMKSAQPVVESLGRFLGTLGESLGEMLSAMSGGIGAAAGVFDGLGSVIQALLPTLGSLTGEILKVAGPVLSKLLTALGPVILQIGEALMPVIDALGPVLSAAADAVIALVQAVLPLLPPIAQLVAALLPALTPILQACIPLFGALAQVVAALVPILIPIITLVAQLASILANYLAAFITSVVVPAVQAIAALLKGDFSGALDLAKTAIKNAALFVLMIFTRLPGQLWAAIKPLELKIGQVALAAGAKLVQYLKDKGNEAIAFVKSLPAKAAQVLAGINNTLRNAGIKLIAGFISGITSQFGAVKSTLGGLTSKLTDWKGPAPLDKRILSPNGRLVIDGFVNGIADRIPTVKRQLQGLTSDLPGMAMDVSPKGVMAASIRQGQTVTFDVTGADEDMKRLIRRIVKNDGRGSVQTAFGTR